MAANFCLKYIYKARRVQAATEFSIGNQPVLTISIPTFNRLDCLRLLVETVIHQATSARVLGEIVEILICNNASTDGTNEYLNGLAKIQGVRVIHHIDNCGGDANILFCCQEAKSKYLWIIGDDDVPLPGTIQAVLGCLERDNPDLLYLPAQWQEDDLSEVAKNKIESDAVLAVDSMELAIRSSIYVTFISSWVLNLDSYRRYAHPPMLDRFRGTSFTQLEWTLTLLNRGEKLFCANSYWIIARAGSSGGYSVFEAFSRQYNRIVEEKLVDNPKLYRYYQRCMLWCFIPGLIWAIRSNGIGDFGEFDKEKVSSILKSAYGEDIFYMLIVAPMIKLNKPMAWCFRLLARILAECRTCYYRMLYA